MIGSIRRDFVDNIVVAAVWTMVAVGMGFLRMFVKVKVSVRCFAL